MEIYPIQKTSGSKNKISAGKKVPVQTNRWRKLTDKLAAGIIRSGGLLVMIVIMGLLALFTIEIAPLWHGAKVKAEKEFKPEEIGIAGTDEILAVGSEEYRKIGFVISRKGRVNFFSLENLQLLRQFHISLAASEMATTVWLSRDESKVAIGTNQGRVFWGQLNFHPTFAGSRRVFDPEVSFAEPISFMRDPAPLVALAAAGNFEEGLVISGIDEKGKLSIYNRQVESSLLGVGEATEYRTEAGPFKSPPTALILEETGNNLFVATRNGQLLKYGLSDPENPNLLESHQAADTAITVLGFLIGDRSLVVGDARGNVSVWFETFDENNKGPRTLKKVHILHKHSSPVVAFAASPRNRTFFTGSRDGDLMMQFSTNERLLSRQKWVDFPVKKIQFTPKGNGALVLSANKRVVSLSIDNPHPEASWKSFFGKIWYEGYPRPSYEWQSSSGSDDFEAKLSLIPLIFGTLKGTFYAMLFALPLALFSAIYVSQFMHPNWKNSVKPVMEIMAALPSVIIGFIGGLWLAPRVQQVAPGIFAMFIVIPLAVAFLSWIWPKLRFPFLRWFDNGFEVVFIIPFVILLAWILLSLNPFIESAFFAGDFHQWLTDTLNLTYDQRNAFVVGLVMGFAVIPLIFTISEDALSNVPTSLSAASLALGATRWQTALKIVLPTATPGIFSATMIGLGRAIGETMIVLMATGNTPVMDWNIFNGFRTLSANIAVEIPEAPEGGTLFRTLFLSALLLFIMTFLVNTVAEIVRQRMRKKYESP